MRFSPGWSPFLIAAILLVSVAPAARADDTVTCGSENNRYNHCDLETHGYVTLSRQLSGAECLKGRTWDFDRRGIWVDDGCRAEFRVETYDDDSFGSGPSVAGQEAYSVTCESQGNGYRRCDLATSGTVTMTRQLSGTRCLQGQTWDYDQRSIWVDKGCRAEFRVEPAGRHDGGSGSHDAKVAAGVVLGAAILGALVHNSDRQDDHKYQDENYHGPRHSSYVPDWMVGTFRGYNPLYGKDVVLTISSDGRVAADADGQAIRGYINDESLHVGSYIFDVDRTREGFVTHQVGDRHNEVYYRRIR